MSLPFGQEFERASNKMETTDKVIIIEDNRETCFFLVEVLDMIGIESICVETLKESDSLLQNVHPTSIFLDNDLPDGLGFDYIPKFKELHPDCRIIAMTANSSVVIKQNALNSGADYLLEKPFSIGQVLNTVTNNKYESII